MKRGNGRAGDPVEAVLDEAAGSIRSSRSKRLLCRSMCARWQSLEKGMAPWRHGGELCGIAQLG